MNYLKEVIQKNKILVCSYVILGVFLAFLNNFSVTYFQQLIDRFNNETLIISTIVIYGTVLIVMCILNYLDVYPEVKLKHGIFLDLKLKALHKISKIDYRQYQTMGTGKLVQRIENGATAGKNILVDFYFQLLRELIPSILFSMVFIYQISKSIMYVILGGYVIVFLVTNLLLKSLYKIKERILTNEERLNHYLIRGFMEMVVFRINKRFRYEIDKAADSKKDIVDSKVKMTLIHESFFTVFALLVTFIKIGIILYGWATKSITIGAIIALVTLVDNAYTPIAIFNVLFVQYKLDKSAFYRFTDFLNTDNDKQLEKGMDVQKLYGNINFNAVSFSYDERVILHKFDLKIEKSEKIALVGESGSGKSTLVKLLIGLLKPNEGEIAIDNYKLSQMKLNSYYDNISYISQESPVFDGTLKENLVFDKVFDNESIIEVLKKVNLYELYLKLEHGLNTELGEKGVMLSGGERQRLALARLWFQDTSIIILDEATSAMDNLTEESAMNQVLDFLSEKTVIVIAHRLNSIREFKRIIAFKDGDIVGEGSFEELMDDNFYFRELYNANVGSI
jgi:ATP-binding cassette subfamily B protein